MQDTFLLRLPRVSGQVFVQALHIESKAPTLDSRQIQRTEDCRLERQGCLQRYRVAMEADGRALLWCLPLVVFYVVDRTEVRRLNP